MSAPDRRQRAAGLCRRVSLLVVAVAAAFTAYGTARATALGPAATGQRPSANQSGTRVFTFVYSGSGFVEVVQHVDNRPGHEGPEWNDTYTKQAKWSISWPVTIENDQITKVGDPTGTVSGMASADLKSSAGQSCGPSPISKPVANGKPYIGTNFEVVNTTKQFITVRLSGNTPLSGFPLQWAAAPACLSGEGTVSHVSTTYSRASVAWGNSWGAPEFKIAPAINNYKITPAEVGNRFPFPPVGINKKVVFDWSARLTIAGFAPKGPPPAKPKPCTPAARPPQPLDQAYVDNYLRSFGPEVEKWVRDVGAEDIPEDSSLPPEVKEILETYGVGCRAETAGGLGQADGPDPGVQLDDYFREKRAPLPPDLMIYPTDFAATSSPDVLNVTGDGTSGSSRTPSGMQAPGAASARWGIRIRINSAGVKALRTGKPFPVTLTATFRVKGKPPIRATTKIVLRGPRPVTRIDSVTFAGSPQNPSIVARGKNLGKLPAPNPAGHPSGQQGCPVIAGDNGYDYGTSLYVVGVSKGFAGGRYRPSLPELDCIDLVVTKFTSTEVGFHFGPFYAQNYTKFALNPDDVVQVVINGASITVHVKYSAPVSS